MLRSSHPAASPASGSSAAAASSYTYAYPAAAAAAAATPTQHIQPVTTQTIRILEEMKAALTCKLCSRLLHDAHSLPCQHHFCLSCIEPSLERIGGCCPTCRNQFWSKDLILNTSINSMIENYRRMHEWIHAKAQRLGQIDRRGQFHEKKPPPRDDDEDDAAGGGDGADEGAKENRSRRTDANASTPRQSSGSSSKLPPSAGGAATTTSTPRRRTLSPNNNSHNNVDQSVFAFPPSPPPPQRLPTPSVVEPDPSTTRTPQRASLRDTIQAAGNETTPISSLAALPKPTGTLFSIASVPPTVGSHSKNFNKQTVVKKTPSPIPTSAAPPPSASPTAAATTQAIRCAPDSTTNHTVETGVTHDEEDEVQEVSPNQFKDRRANNNATPTNANGIVTNVNDNNANSKRTADKSALDMIASAVGMSTSHSIALLKSTPLPPHKHATAVGPSKGSTLKQFFRNVNNDPSNATTNILQTNNMSSPVGSSALSSVDNAAGVVDGPLIQKPDSPPKFHSPSIHLKNNLQPLPLSGSCSSSASRPSSESQPPATIEGSLSLPRYASASPKDLFGSPPPLELAPPINLYSPAPAIWKLGASESLSEEQSQQPQQPQSQQPEPEVQPMEIETENEPVPPPQRRSLAKDMATLQEAHAGANVSAVAAAVAAPVPTVESALSSMVEPVLPVSDLPRLDAPIVSMPGPSAAAAVTAAIAPSTESTDVPVVVGVGVGAVSRSVSQATAMSVQLSLPPLTETSVAMPSMNGTHLSLTPADSQHQPQPPPPPARTNSTNTVATHVTMTLPISPTTNGAGGGVVNEPITTPPPSASKSTPPVIIADTPSSVANGNTPPPLALPTSPPNNVNNNSAAHTTVDPMQNTLSIPMDIGVTPSPPIASSLVTTKPISIAFSSLAPEERNQLVAFATRLGSCISNTKGLWSSDVTHVISKVRPDPHRLAARSLKYMHGILCGAWILTWAWVEASMQAGKWVDERPYEVDGDASKGVSHTPRLMRQRLESSNGERLLKGLKICVYHDLVPNRDPSVIEVQTMIEHGHGTIIPTPTPTPPSNQTNNNNNNSNHTNHGSTSLLAQSGIRRVSSLVSTLPGPIYLLMRGDAHRVYTADAMSALGAELGMVPVTVPWLLDSISLGRILPVDLFRCDITPEQKRARKEEMDRAAAAAPTPAPAAINRHDVQPTTTTL